MQKLDIEFSRVDERGSLTQVNTGIWKQLNCILIKKGQTFGGHYHKHKKELFYILKGNTRLEVERIIRRPGSLAMRNMVDFKAGECFLIEPYDKHTLTAIEDTEIVELLSEPFDKKDVWIK